MKFVSIDADGTKNVIYAEDGEQGSYNAIKGYINDTIERVHLHLHDADMWINDNGKALQLDQNPMATAMWVEMYGKTDVIVGGVIITGGADEEGNTLGLTDEQVDTFLQWDEEVVVGLIGERVLFMYVIGEAEDKF